MSRWQKFLDVLVWRGFTNPGAPPMWLQFASMVLALVATLNMARISTYGTVSFWLWWSLFGLSVVFAVVFLTAWIVFRLQRRTDPQAGHAGDPEPAS